MDISFKEFGAPGGDPMIYCHGCPGSHLEAELLQDAAWDHNIRLIAFDRPGFGETPHVRGRTLRDEVKCVEAVADHLNLDRFAISGASGGATTALAAAHFIPDRLTFVASVVGWAPVADIPALQKTMAPLDRAFFSVAGAMPFLFGPPFAFLGWRISRGKKSLMSILKSSLSETDRAMIERDEAFADFLVRDMQEAFRHGSAGPARDAWLRYRPWGFDLAEVTTPVSVYAGDDDKFAPLALAEAVNERLPHSTLKVWENTGHLTAFSQFGDVFSDMRRTLDTLA
ncbi:alpha/beta fold hydrolase [Cucumibacter marinus]|uniref:alpha/beta fold hydrolase n=1 Tax=Cucumibacter marinus TaxID=1121252 RepID=UPI000425BF56|nr:alpha/beta hydrolase [Cucumibacter marinus]